MSKITNPVTQPSVTCGFFNAVEVDGEADRLYYAEEMCSLFDGIIKDGVFMSIGDQLRVTADTGINVCVGVGKAWFNHTWTKNDAPLIIECEASEVLQDRIDAVILEVDATTAVRDCSIYVIKGTPDSKNPAKPILENSEHKHQYALCYIYRKADSTVITQANIENAVGTAETPFISGLMQTVSLDQLLGQWQAQLDEFVASESAELDKFTEDKYNEYNAWFDEMKTLMAEATTELDNWTTSQQTTILSWFDNIRDQLSADSAVNLQLQIDEHEIKSILQNGFAGCEKTISADGTVMTSVDSVGRTLVTTFTNEFLTSTTVLTDENNTELGRLVKNISSDGLTITSEITLM